MKINTRLLYRYFIDRIKREKLIDYYIQEESQIMAEYKKIKRVKDKVKYLQSTYQNFIKLTNKSTLF